MKHLLFALASTVFSFSLTQAQTSIKIMSYNIHHCNPPSKPDFIDIDAVANAIKKENPDIVALQEVDVNTGRSGKVNEAAQLALKTGMKSFYFAKAIDHDGGDYGVAILSKYPLTETETHHLPMDTTTGGEPRVLATASVQLPGGKVITIGSTHLDAQKAHTNRLLQIKAINSITREKKQPMIIAGDFNAEENTEVIKTLDQQFKRTCGSCKPTIPVIKPKKAIDFIAYKPQNAFKVTKHEVINETYASDHLPVTSILEIN
ncbi:endonuclease/exonuclease/phosphatase family protein [Niabella ginsengisoli]|uniref:Endonuclease/exonuclease/phosphatase family protein n=1 Tax=Niabella ginsengisoli TaxID=522298 RepID=A0ABS9SIM0_9BACT|nr:endonuclease/exonuclease/phosphatase family protein [Niabella ginsengisoli]MCH5598200.1 endonuclease/exonuclease/phosphatase family protein [Niabella ginsengisoli]